MSSEIKVDTISENTSGNGVAIDGLTIKDGGITATTGATVFNEASADVDFRVESNDATHQLFVDAGNNKIYVGSGSGSSIDNMHLQLHNQGLTVSSFAGDANSNEIHFIKSRNTTVGSNTIVNNGDQLGAIIFQGDDGGDYATPGASIQGVVGGTPGTNDMPGMLKFSTTADGANSVTERVRIESTGQLAVLRSGQSTFFDTAHKVVAELPSDDYAFLASQNATAGAGPHYFAKLFTNGQSLVGSITVSNTGSAFNTSSDYRLKENVETDWNATTRLKQLKPSRFNFKADADTTVDGFLAHEVSSIVPEAITGDKDATETKTKVVVNSSGFIIHQDVEEADWTAGKVADEEGNTRYPSDSTWEASKVVPVYQGIDQSKLVPLMVKTIQELEARIVALES